MAKQPLGIELVKRGYVSAEDIEKALDYQSKHRGKKIGDILYILGNESPERLIQGVAEILDQKGILLTNENVNPELLEYIPLDVMKKNKAIPFEVEGGKIKVAFADTHSSKANINSIRLLMLNRGLVLDSYIAFESNVDEFLEKYETGLDKNIDELEETSSVTELIDNIIKIGMDKRASDIHIEPQSDGVRVRYRIDGELFVVANIEKEKQEQMIGRLKAISNMHQEKQESQDGRILMYKDYNIRVSSQKNIYGEKFVLRLLKKETDVRNIFDLGFPYSAEELERVINKKNSITIMAAPTGEGKTTSLYSILDYLQSDNLNITTIEDPVEIRIPGLNQIEIDKNVRFADSLRTILRQDPDIILVGEIRDKETAEIAIQAGQTGHYVLSTIHTIDAIEAITRLRKMGLSDYDISSTVATVISQRLVRKLCPKCKKEREFSEQEKDVLKKYSEKYNVSLDYENTKTYDAIGCDYCNHSGYYDRIGIFEVLEITEDLKELIVNGASSFDIRRKALEHNYRPMVIDGLRKIISGETNMPELNRKILILNNI